MPPLLDHRGQKLSQQWSDIEFFELGAHRTFGDAAKPFIVERFHDVAEQARGTHSHAAFAGTRRGKKSPHRARDVHRPHFSGNDARTQKVGPQKAC